MCASNNKMLMSRRIISDNLFENAIFFKRQQKVIDEHLYYQMAWSRETLS